MNSNPIVPVTTVREISNRNAKPIFLRNFIIPTPEQYTIRCGLLKWGEDYQESDRQPPGCQIPCGAISILKKHEALIRLHRKLGGW
jgi:hypothetical protein